MKYILRFLASVACLFVFASCSDDPVSSSGSGHFTPEYQPTLLSMVGGFSTVCGVGSKDIYAVGYAILHHDGQRWTTIAAPNVRYGGPGWATAFPDGRVVVNGPGTFVLENGAWRDISDPEVSTGPFWGTSPENLYALAYQGLRHFDGTTWSTVLLPDAQPYVRAIAGRSNNDIAVTGDYGRMYRFDGAQWTATTIDSNISYGSLAFTESGQLYGTGYREVYDIASTNHLILRAVIEAPSLCTDGDVLYAGGTLTLNRSYFVIERYQDGLWNKVAVDKGSVYTMWAGGGRVVAVGNNNSIWSGSQAGGQMETLIPTRGNFTCAANIDGALFAGGQYVFRYEDGVWTDLNKRSITQDDIIDIAGVRRNDVYAIGHNMLLHYDGSDWTWVNSAGGNYAMAVWVDKSTGVWIGDSEGGGYRLHGTTLSPEDLGLHGHRVFDIWGDDNVMVAVGSAGSASIRKDGVWHYIPTGSSHPLYAVWGFNPEHIYAADYFDHQVYAYDGRTWKTMTLDIPDDYMVSIWGTSPANIFATGSDGSLVHFDGDSWKPLERVFSDERSVVCGTGSEVLALGYRGVVSYRR
jgi:hypothetical protein